MRMFCIALAALLLPAAVFAGQPEAPMNPAAAEVVIPEYAYCEIIANHLPRAKGSGVVFDFGQQTGAWAYNWLHDVEGNRMRFKSGIEALNFMVFRGWEFTQAFTAGKEMTSIHYLLRIPTSRLSSEQLQQLSEPPQGKSRD